MNFSTFNDYANLKFNKKKKFRDEKNICERLTCLGIFYYITVRFIPAGLIYFNVR